MTNIFQMAWFNHQVEKPFMASQPTPRNVLPHPEIRPYDHGLLTICFLDGGFKHFLLSPLFEEDSHFDSYFSNGLVQPPTSFP